MYVRTRELSAEEQSDRTQRNAKRVSSNTSRKSEKNLGVRPAILYYVLLQEIHKTKYTEYSVNRDRCAPRVANWQHQLLILKPFRCSTFVCTPLCKAQPNITSILVTPLLLPGIFICVKEVPLTNFNVRTSTA